MTLLLDVNMNALVGIANPTGGSRNGAHRPPMLFALRESFSPRDGPRWQTYCQWRGLKLERFDSIDGILRPSLFTPRAAEEWSEVLNEDYKIELMTSRQFAVRKRAEIGRGDVVGIAFADHNEADSGFLGYDLVDGCFDVSLLTNWGNHHAFDPLIGSNGLVRDRAVVAAIQGDLVRTARDDGHVEGCRVVSIYR